VELKRKPEPPTRYQNQNFNWALKGALYTKAAVKEQRRLKGHGLSFLIILLVA
jgi:hypothetical protein